MPDVGILSFSPNLVQTPNAYFSKKSCINHIQYSNKDNKRPLDLLKLSY